MEAFPSLSQIPTADDLDLIRRTAIATGFTDKQQRIRAYRACLMFDNPNTPKDFSTGRYFSELARKQQIEEDKRTIEIDAIRTHGQSIKHDETRNSAQKELAHMLKTIILENEIPCCRYTQGMNEIFGLIQRYLAPNKDLVWLFAKLIFEKHLL